MIRLIITNEENKKTLIEAIVFLYQINVNTVANIINNVYIDQSKIIIIDKTIYIEKYDEINKCLLLIDLELINSYNIIKNDKIKCIFY